MDLTFCLNGRNCTGEILSWLKSDIRVVPGLLEKESPFDLSARSVHLCHI